MQLLEDYNGYHILKEMTLKIVFVYLVQTKKMIQFITS